LRLPLSDERLRALPWQGAFFVAGALIHLWLLHRYARHLGAGGQAIAFRPLTQLGMAMIGGACVTWFFSRLLRKTLAGQLVPAWRVLLRGALYGMAATVFTWEFLYLAVAAVIVIKNSGSGMSFHLWLMEISTYGGEPLVTGSPFALVYGAAGGGACLWAKRLAPDWTPAPSPPGMSRESLWLGILGVVFRFAPVFGIILGFLAVIFGARTLRLAPRDARVPRWPALAGLILGSICVLWLVFGFAYYVYVLHHP
jgi:hypothetical protein